MAKGHNRGPASCRSGSLCCMPVGVSDPAAPGRERPTSSVIAHPRQRKAPGFRPGPKECSRAIRYAAFDVTALVSTNGGGGIHREWYQVCSGMHRFRDSEKSTSGQRSAVERALYTRIGPARGTGFYEQENDCREQTVPAR
jgi:hypothetical protein